MCSGEHLHSAHAEREAQRFLYPACNPVAVPQLACGEMGYIQTTDVHARHSVTIKGRIVF